MVSSWSKFQNFLDEKFSGLDPADIIFLMTLPDPETSVASKAAETVDKSEGQTWSIGGKLGYCLVYKDATGNSADGCQLTETSDVSPDDLFEAKEIGKDVYNLFMPEPTLVCLINVQGGKWVKINKRAGSKNRAGWKDAKS